MQQDSDFIKALLRRYFSSQMLSKVIQGHPKTSKCTPKHSKDTPTHSNDTPKYVQMHPISGVGFVLSSCAIMV
jgi:hypothetical protein